jgi:alpha-D-ribose 1-methylphosphonate 5-triphosphate synthase subunit PhnI
VNGSVIDFLSGAVTLGFLVAAVFFLRFWRRTHDRLFIAFAAAFVLMALNQALAAFLGAGDELAPFTYILRVLGFVLILFAIVDKNLSNRRSPRQPSR